MKTIRPIILLIFCSTLYAQGPDRSKPPDLGAPPLLTLPPIQHLKLSNGLPVVLLEKHEVPLVQINLLVRVGSTMDLQDQTGLASMTVSMMEEGAGTRNALELADAIDFLGASISTGTGTHTSVVALHTPLSKLDSALALFADVALRPTFPPDELDRERKQRLTTLLQWHDEPRSVASVLFNRTLFGTKHPYGLPSIGNEKNIRSFKVADLSKFYGMHFVPSNSTLIVVGDIAAATLLPKLEALFGSWKSGMAPTRSWPDVDQVKKREVLLVDKPGAAQSEIRIGRIGAARLTDDYYPLVVMNTILGGSFTSRLNTNLREVHGYSYGARTLFDFRPLPGVFLALAAVQTDVTDSALVEFMKELRGILETVDAEELTRAKNYVALSFPSEFQTVGDVAGKLSEIVLYNLPDGYFNQYVTNIQAVTADDVQRVARKYIDPEKVAIIIVGDRKKVEDGIRGLNLGPLKTMTIEDVLGKKPVVQ
ncbi:MAG: insulinase family protein [Ignavibacteriae bacterium]|nr:insulinase family protein [Ignavibacteriota bacterium]